ncbi:TRAP transporter substrate-binding protein [Isoptericola sp. BMS4]|uniref:TRAP transporter substrate-binding protein n=1 Tax=Isoptericola sp. BMS4 TaxID=2527875 RepID=UPI0014244DDB|nr:TRAP transporter substrate-binding protein [Isoptericola sp. BMS4]
MKKLLAVLATVLLTTGLAACAPASGPPATSAEATAENPLVLSLAHSLGDTHVTSKALAAFAEDVEERSDGRIVVRIYGNGQLGSEPDVIAQLNQGVIDMARVAAPSLANDSPAYHTFGLPYIFESKEEYYRVMDSPEMADFFRSSVDDGFVGLTYYTSGARSFYTAHTAVRTPDDLRGLKIRVQDMRSQTQLMEVLGAAPVAMGFGEIYTALQTGLIDGAESNETALTDSAHGEVAKVFSRDEHTRIPDMLVMSSDTWRTLTPADQELITAAARRSTKQHKVAWDESVQQAVADAEDMGVEFVDDVDVEAFREMSRPLVDEYAEEYPEVAELLATIDEAKE